MAVRLTRIRAYPLKGAAGFDLQETGLDGFGIPGDEPFQTWSRALR